MTHQQWVRLGDIVTEVKDWAITVVCVVVAAFSAAVLGVVTFLFFLDLAGKALT